MSLSRFNANLKEENILTSHQNQKDTYHELKKNRISSNRSSAVKSQSEDFTRSSVKREILSIPNSLQNTHIKLEHIFTNFHSPLLSMNEDLAKHSHRRTDDHSSQPRYSNIFSENAFNLDISAESKNIRKGKQAHLETRDSTLPRLKIQPISTSSSQTKDFFSARTGSDHWSFKPMISLRSLKKSRPSIEPSTAATYDIESQISLSSRQSKLKNRSSKIHMDLFLKNRMNKNFKELPLFSLDAQNRAKKSNPPEFEEETFRKGQKNFIKLKNLALNTLEVEASEPNLPPAFQEMLDFLQENDSKIAHFQDIPLSKPTDQILLASSEYDEFLNSDKFAEAIVTLDEEIKSKKLQTGQNFFLKTKRSRSSKMVTPVQPNTLSSLQLDLKPVISSPKKQTPAKKQFYNKWYMPTEKWNVEKQPSYKETLLKELRKNNLYLYESIHDYQKKKDLPLPGDQDTKTIHQMRYETAQQQIKQNPMIYAMKRNLSENNVRIPLYLKDV